MKYIFLDIDGTLFDHGTYSIPESARKAVELARKAGNRVFICTGRACSLLEQVEDIEYDGVVAAAGAYVQIGEKVIYEDSIPVQELNEMMEECVSMGVSYILEGKTGVYMHKDIQEYFAVGGGHKRKAHEFFQQKTVHGMDAYDPETEVIYKFCLYTPKEERLEEIKRRYIDGYQFVYSIPDREKIYSVEVVPKRNNKAKGIRKAVEYYGGSMEDTVAVGDSMNDLEMIRECAIGIVMGNGDERLKAYADYITTDIAEDGVYLALEHYGLLGPASGQMSGE